MSHFSYIRTLYNVHRIKIYLHFTFHSKLVVASFGTFYSNWNILNISSSHQESELMTVLMNVSLQSHIRTAVCKTNDY